MEQKLWWQKPLRILQTNLQIQDTPLMDPEKIARETEELGANGLVINAGGIYAWYPSKIPFHHVNEYLPEDRDLFSEIIDACHRRGIRVIARFDFSKAEDRTYQLHPEWFVRYADGSTRRYGKERPGNWSLLVTTCLNAGYRNEEVAIPVVKEALSLYPIDGIFFNAPHYEFCCCDACRRKYEEHYGVPMPVFSDYGEGSPGLPEGLPSDWPSLCLKDSMEKMYRMVKETAPEIPVILYYNGHQSDHLADRVATADMICTESQDILSLGQKNIPQFWRPAISMKMGRTLEDYPAPFGIIHSCPGMDWRHTGLPTAEYEFWMSQIPANGGMIWHSVTGFCDTITDKRILKSVSNINHRIQKTEPAMEDTEIAAEILLIWEGRAQGFAEAMIQKQIPFQILCPDQITLPTLQKYRAVILPEGFSEDAETGALLKAYVSGGGCLIKECGRPDPDLLPVFGIDQILCESPFLAASYLRFADPALQKGGLESTALIPHRGKTWYVRPTPSVQILATLVPPFAPLDAVGSPPERASILCPETDIPLILLQQYGEGRAVYLSFPLSQLISEFALNEHMLLLDNLLGMLLPETPLFEMYAPAGVQATVFRGKNQNRFVVHLVNGVGQRPLCGNVPLSDLSFRLRTDAPVLSIRPLIDEVPVQFSQEGCAVSVTVGCLEVWNAFEILCGEGDSL